MYKFFWSLFVCVVLCALILASAILGTDFLKAEIYNGELPYWIKFFGLGFFGLLIVYVVLMTIGRAGKEVKFEVEKQNKQECEATKEGGENREGS